MAYTITDPTYKIPKKEIRKNWKRLVKVTEPTLGVGATGTPYEDRAYDEAVAHYSGKLSSAASDFLRAQGFKADGSTTRKIPGL